VSITEALDRARWGGVHWRLFSVVSAGYLLDGVIFSIAPLMVYIVAPGYSYIIFPLNLLSEAAGAVSLGHLADRYGRRIMFTLSLILEGASLLLLLPLYNNPLALALLTSIMNYGVGGEFGAAYAAMSELSPARHRGKALMLATNFWNIGAALISGLSIIYTSLAEDPVIQARYLLLTALGVLVIAGVLRLTIPESPRWLLSRGRVREAVEVVSRFSSISVEVGQEKVSEGVGLGEAISKYLFRFVVLAIITVAQYVTYNMLAYYAPYASGFALSQEAVPLVVLIANLGASVGAFLLLPLIDLARRLSTLTSFLGGFLGSLAVLVIHTYLPGSPMFTAVFLTSLFITLIFSEWAWATLSVLQSELFPTGVRSSVVGLLTSLTGISTALVTLFEYAITAQEFLVLATLIWFLGFAASLAWYLRGIESAGKSLEELVR